MEIHNILLFILSDCKMGCKGCHLKNGDRETDKVIRNLTKFLMKYQQYLKENYVDIAFESAGLFTHNSFIKNYLEKIIKLVRPYGITVLETLDYHSHFFNSPYKEYVLELLDKYDMTLTISSPEHKGDPKTGEGAIYPHDRVRILSAELVPLRGDILTGNAYTQVYNFPKADCFDNPFKNSYKEDFYNRLIASCKHMLEEDYDRAVKNDIRSTEVSVLIDDSDHGYYLTPRLFSMAKFLFSIPLTNYEENCKQLQETYADYYNLIRNSND